jgi:hypothetical protein
VPTGEILRRRKRASGRQKWVLWSGRKEIAREKLVEPMGFEPTTSSMPSRRAPNCATAPPQDSFMLAQFG